MNRNEAVDEKSVEDPTQQETYIRTILACVFSFVVSPYFLLSNLGISCLDDNSGYSTRCHATAIEPIRGLVMDFMSVMSLTFFCAFFALLFRLSFKMKDISMLTFGIIIGVGIGVIVLLNNVFL